MHNISEAPGFTLRDSDDKPRALDDFRGKWVVLYFYPKDDTPGCTTEACSFRDARDELAELGAEIVGISRDNPGSHERFKAKHSLNFTLLSDPTGEVINRYGAMKANGGTARKTFIINPDGKIVKEYARVTPLGHAEQVKIDLQALIQRQTD